MAELRIPADELRIGDLIDIGDGQITEVRALQRGDQGLIITNPGDFDEITGRVWDHVTVTRKETPAMTDIAQQLRDASADCDLMTKIPTWQWKTN